MADDDSEDVKPRGRPRRPEWALPVTVAAVPFAVATIKLYTFARGDREIFAAAMTTANLTSLWLIFAAGIGQFLLAVSPAIAYLMYRVRMYRNPRSRRSRLISRQLAGSTIAAIILALGTGLLFGNLPVALLCVAMITIYGFVEFASTRAEQREPYETRSEFVRRISQARDIGYRAQRQVFPFSFALVAIAIVARGPLGLPLEIVKVNNETAPSLGYVLDVDDVSLTLAYYDGGLRHILTSEVEGRSSCPADSFNLPQTFQSRSGIEIFMSYVDNEPPYEPTECRHGKFRTGDRIIDL